VLIPALYKKAVPTSKNLLAQWKALLILKDVFGEVYQQREHLEACNEMRSTGIQFYRLMPSVQSRVEWCVRISIAKK
jgi:hypothetical protein